MLSIFSRRVLLTLPAASPLLSFTHRNNIVAADALSSGVRMSLRCALTSGLSLRYFSNTPTRLSDSAGIVHCSKLCLGDFGVRAKGKPHDASRYSVRLHGTVTAFKHRRGYGFVLGEGVTAAAQPHRHRYVPLAPQAAAADGKGINTEPDPSPSSAQEEVLKELPKSFFFTRGSLQGGFYVTEGERVSFTVAPVRRGEGINRRVAGDAHSTRKDDADDGALAAANAAELSPRSAEGWLDEPNDTGASSTPSQHHLVAVDFRYYDAKTGKETPITPLTLYGKVVEWDAEEGFGMIAELDTRRQFHEDAPRFPFCLNNVDLALGTELRAGRYVRFCLEPAVPVHGGANEDSAAATTLTTGAGAAGGAAECVELVAQRVIIDTTMERRKGISGRPLVLADAAPGTMSSESRFSGVVRELKADSFGFIQDDLSGESIFFHLSNSSSRVKAGDRVTYLLREIDHGKHAGKKGCFDVLVDETAASRMPDAFDSDRAAAGAGNAGWRRQDHAAARRSKTQRDGDDLDFELLD
ncbi:hypothetical protein GH5_05634 [Leishmania sp. Ghana 2012 LV757]|uniref:hypothetical protein n=1 Tax=Leishmania sp. Ghana 2012 LV757 TaxID=2803181 RepID=UPI001B60055C|nr:hypothetical protein GH5_05634 [Leishmania sp. Ghana 2012 LV757]